MRVSCYSCLAEYEVGPEQGLAGSSFECGECGEQVEVPEDLGAASEEAVPAQETTDDVSDGPETIQLSCGDCGEAYDISSDDGLDGMSFPCDACGADIEVPMFSERVDRDDLALPDVAKANAISGGASITLSCFSCLEEYNLHAEDGLAGMDFPCEVCGEDINVPDHPWPEVEEEDFDEDFFNVGTPVEEDAAAGQEEADDTPAKAAAKNSKKKASAEDGEVEDGAESGGLEIPPEVEAPEIEGGTKITISCFACLEEYNLSADDGLAGMSFPCDACGEMVDVPPHPWPDDEPEDEFDEDFFNVGTPMDSEGDSSSEKGKPDGKPAAKPKPKAKPKAKQKPKPKAKPKAEGEAPPAEVNSQADGDEDSAVPSETRSQEELRRDAFGDDLGHGPVEASVDYGAAAGTSSSPMPKRVGGGGGRRPAAAGNRPKMVSPSKAKGIGGVVGGRTGGGASEPMEAAAPAAQPPSGNDAPGSAKPRRFMKGLMGFFKQKLSRKPKPDKPESTLEMPDLSRASLRAEMRADGGRSARKELTDDAPQSRKGPRLAAALGADIERQTDVEMSPEAEALFEQARQAAIRARMMSLALVAAVGLAGVALWDRIFPAIPTDQGGDANLSKFFEDRAYDDEGVDAEGNPLSDELLSDEQQEVRQSRDLGPDTVDLLGYIDLKAKVVEVAKANQMADRSVLMWARYRLGRHFGDTEARKLLLQDSPGKFDTEKFGSLGIGAIAGALNWQGKAGKVRKQAAKLTESEGANAPQLQFVLADGFLSTKRPNLKKALPHLEQALADDEPFLDAMLLWAKHDADKWSDEDFYQRVLTTARESGDADSKLRVAQALLQGKSLARLGEAIAGMDWDEEVAPSRNGLRLSLRAGQALSEAKLDKVASLLSDGATAAPSASSFLGAARAVEAVEGASAALTWLDNQSTDKLTPKAKAILLAERGRLSIESGNPEGAKRQLKLLRSIPGKANDGWSAVTKARITRAGGDLNGAKAILSRASKGRKKSIPAMVELERWNSEDSAPSLERSTSMLQGPVQGDALLLAARAALARGETESAGDYLGTLMWQRPGEASPMETSLVYAQWLEASGRSSEGAAILDKLGASRPNDPALVKLLMERARAAGDKAKAAELFQKLMDIESATEEGTESTP